MSIALVVLSSFLASAVEMVEALTIVLAVGTTRSWRSALTGAALAAAVLAAVIAALGPALTVIPIDALRVVVGSLLLVFGVQWLRKAVLRASGLKALHDEDATYAAEVDQARHARATEHVGLDWYSFTVAFKGVFLEGLEVAFIVLTFGSARHAVGWAALGAFGAVVVVVGAGIVVHAPLARVPENSLKFAVGVMLTGFGTFWAGEGVGVNWPGNDAALPVVIAFFSLVAAVLVHVSRRPALAAPDQHAAMA
ncbi:MAG: hypothetical protein JO265_01855 [Acidimicrobiia bacterium]|nr:hypothetical protein [Acidimicrobiia bacterium]